MAFSPFVSGDPRQARGHRHVKAGGSVDTVL